MRKAIQTSRKGPIRVFELDQMVSGYLGLEDKSSFAKVNKSSQFVVLNEKGRDSLVSELSAMIATLFDPVTGTLNLISAKDQNPIPIDPVTEETILSPADHLAKFWSGCAEVRGETNYWEFAESLTKEALALAMRSIIETHPEAQIRNIIVSKSLETPFIPKAIANLDGLEYFEAIENKHLKKIETLADRVNCIACTSATSLNFPNADSVNCIACTSATSLDFPNADFVNCTYCTKANSLNFPNAAVVECTGCISATSLDFPSANEVLCSGCTSATSLKFPNADVVECAGCSSATFLHFPNAKEAFCSGCSKATSVKVLAGCAVAGYWQEVTFLTPEQSHEEQESQLREYLIREEESSLPTTSPVGLAGGSKVARSDVNASIDPE